MLTVHPSRQPHSATAGCAGHVARPIGRYTPRDVAPVLGVPFGRSCPARGRTRGTDLATAHASLDGGRSGRAVRVRLGNGIGPLRTGLVPHPDRMGVAAHAPREGVPGRPVDRGAGPDPTGTAGSSAPRRLLPGSIPLYRRAPRSPADRGPDPGDARVASRRNLLFLGATSRGGLPEGIEPGGSPYRDRGTRDRSGWSPSRSHTPSLSHAFGGSTGLDGPHHHPRAPDPRSTIAGRCRAGPPPWVGTGRGTVRFVRPIGLLRDRPALFPLSTHDLVALFPSVATPFPGRPRVSDPVGSSYRWGERRSAPWSGCRSPRTRGATSPWSERRGWGRAVRSSRRVGGRSITGT